MHLISVTCIALWAYVAFVNSYHFSKVICWQSLAQSCRKSRARGLLKSLSVVVGGDSLACDYYTWYSSARFSLFTYVNCFSVKNIYLWVENRHHPPCIDGVNPLNPRPNGAHYISILKFIFIYENRYISFQVICMVQLTISKHWCR